MLLNIVHKDALIEILTHVYHTSELFHLEMSKMNESNNVHTHFTHSVPLLTPHHHMHVAILQRARQNAQIALHSSCIGYNLLIEQLSLNINLADINILQIFRFLHLHK